MRARSLSQSVLKFFDACDTATAQWVSSETTPSPFAFLPPPPQQACLKLLRYSRCIRLSLQPNTFVLITKLHSEQNSRDRNFDEYDYFGGGGAMRFVVVNTAGDTTKFLDVRVKECWNIAANLFEFYSSLRFQVYMRTSNNSSNNNDLNSNNGDANDDNNNNNDTTNTNTKNSNNNSNKIAFELSGDHCYSKDDLDLNVFYWLFDVPGDYPACGYFWNEELSQKLQPCADFIGISPLVIRHHVFEWIRAHFFQSSKAGTSAFLREVEKISSFGQHWRELISSGAVTRKIPMVKYEEDMKQRKKNNGIPC